MRRTIGMVILVAGILLGTISSGTYASIGVDRTGGIESFITIPKESDTRNGGIVPIELRLKVVTDNLKFTHLTISREGNGNAVFSARVTLDLISGSIPINPIVYDTQLSQGPHTIIGSPQSVASGDVLTIIVHVQSNSAATVNATAKIIIPDIEYTIGTNTHTVTGATSNITISGFEAVTANSAVSENIVLGGHHAFPVVRLDIGPLQHEALDNNKLEVVVQRRNDDIIHGVKLCEDNDKNNKIDSDCGTLASFTGTTATASISLGTPGLGRLGTTTPATASVLVVYDLRTTHPDTVADIQAKITKVFGTGKKSKQEINVNFDTNLDNAAKFSTHYINASGITPLVGGVTVTIDGQLPAGPIVAGVTQDMMTVKITAHHVTANINTFEIGKGDGAQFQVGEDNRIKQVFIATNGKDSVSTNNNTAVDSVIADITSFGFGMVSGNEKFFTIQYEVSEASGTLFQAQAILSHIGATVTVNGTRYITKPDEFEFPGVPASSNLRTINFGKVTIQTISTSSLNFIPPSTNAGQQDIPLFRFDILNKTGSPIEKSLTLFSKKTLFSNSNNGFDVNNTAITRLIMKQNDIIVGETAINNTSTTASISFEIATTPSGPEAYDLYADMGQHPDSAGTYTIQIATIDNTINFTQALLKDQAQAIKQTFTNDTTCLRVTFDNQGSAIQTTPESVSLMVENQCLAPVTINNLTLAIYDDIKGTGTKIFADVTPEVSTFPLLTTNPPKNIRVTINAVSNIDQLRGQIIPEITFSKADHSILFSRYQDAADTVSTNAILKGSNFINLAANTDIDAAFVHIASINVGNSITLKSIPFANGDAITAGSHLDIHLREPSTWASVLIEASNSSPGIKGTFDPKTGIFNTDPLDTSGSFTLIATPNDGSLARTVVLSFIISDTLSVSDALFYPNPYNTGAGPLEFSLNSTQEGTVTLTLYDMRGRRVLHHKMDLTVGYNEKTLPSTQSLGSGIYVGHLEIRDTTGKKVVETIRLAVY